MWNKINLRTRIYVILTALVCITMVGGFVMVWYTYRMQSLLNHMIDKNVAAFQAAEALEIALVNQKGFVSYYFLDGDPDWLRQLGEYRQIFRERLNDARSRAAKLLGLSRPTLHSKIEKYRLKFDTLVKED